MDLSGGLPILLSLAVPVYLQFLSLSYHTISRLVKKLSAKMAVMVEEDILLARTETIWLVSPMAFYSGIRGTPWAASVDCPWYSTML